MCVLTILLTETMLICSQLKCCLSALAVNLSVMDYPFQASLKSLQVTDHNNGCLKEWKTYTQININITIVCFSKIADPLFVVSSRIINV